MTRDFGGLRAIYDEAQNLDAENAMRPLVACPVCGTPLDRRSDGLANCPMGHFTTYAQTEGELSNR